MIRFDSSWDDGEYVWFMGNDNNRLYCMDYDLNIWQFLDLDASRKSMPWGNPYCMKYDNLMICLPSNEKVIKIVNFETYDISEIQLDVKSNRYNIPYCFIVDKYIWCMSTSSGELIKLNLETKRQMDTIELFPPNIDIFTGDIVYDSRLFYAVYPNSNCIMEFDIASEVPKYKEIICNEKGFSTILLYKNEKWITGFRNAIYIISSKDDCGVTEISLEGKMRWDIENEQTSQPRFRNSFLINNRWALFIPKETNNYISDYIAIVDCLTHEVKMFNLNVTGKTRKAAELLIFSHSHNNEIVIYDYMIGKYLSVNIITEDIKILEYKINKNKTQKSFENWKIGNYIMEDDFLGLKEYIGLVGKEE